MSDYKRDLQVTEEKVITTVKVLISEAEKRGRQSVLAELEREVEEELERPVILFDNYKSGRDSALRTCLSLIRSKKGGA
jgi:hypothetical protein